MEINDNYIYDQPLGLPRWTNKPEFLPSTEDLIELYRRHLWMDFACHNPLGSLFQIPTKELIDSLGDVLTEEIERLNQSEVKITELGASNGRLTHFLKQTLEERIKNKPLHIKGVDDFSWDENEEIRSCNGSPYWLRRIFEVEETSMENAINENPDIVISSWMPPHEDWTKLIRSNPNVKVFILIGNPEQCGTEDAWLPDENFERKDLNIKGSICFSDSSPHCAHESIVALFVRK